MTFTNITISNGEEIKGSIFCLEDNLELNMEEIKYQNYSDSPTTSLPSILITNQGEFSLI